jgi:hypothetical protein
MGNESDRREVIFAYEIDGGGSARCTTRGIYSTGCVDDQSKTRMVSGEIDLAYGIHIGAHSVRTITTSNEATLLAEQR